MNARRSETRHPARRPRCARPGQIIFMVVFFLVLLGGMLFLVVNGGVQFNHKIELQTTADAVVKTGAGWYARGLNTVAMCNQVQTHCLAMVLMLDTLETTVPYSVDCIDDLANGLGASKAGHDIPLDERTKDWLAVGNARDEQEIMHRFRDVCDGIDFPEFCRYDDGILWEMAHLMEGFKRAMVEATPMVAQREAIDVGWRNISGEELEDTEERRDETFGFVVPLWPALPVDDGFDFADWENPMRFGRLPEKQGNERIGQYGWGVMNYWGYHHRHMGPFEYWREPYLKSTPMGLFDISRFSVMFRIVSDAKVEMMFGRDQPELSLDEWEMQYDEAKKLEPDEIHRAWWERLHFDCRYEYPKGEFFANMGLRNPKNPVPSTRSYSNMDRPNVEGGGWIRGTRGYEGADPRLAVWYKVVEKQTVHYPQLGIVAPHSPTRADGSDWPYDEDDYVTYYSVSFWRFDGAELEPADDQLHAEYLPPPGSSPDLRPILLDRRKAGWNTRGIQEYFTFNGFAYRPGKVNDWEKRFVNPNPIEDMVAYAQARVYNRWSVDLFTQDWRVDLMRLEAERWKWLAGAMSKSLPAEAGQVGEVLTPDRVEPVRQMIEAYDEAFVKEVTH